MHFKSHHFLHVFCTRFHKLGKHTIAFKKVVYKQDDSYYINCYKLSHLTHNLIPETIQACFEISLLIPLFSSKWKWGTFAYEVIHYYMIKLLKRNYELKFEEQAQVCLVVTNFQVKGFLLRSN